MIATVIAESRRGNTTVLLEKLQGTGEAAFRLTIAKRFPTLTKAQAELLDNIPKSHHQTVIQQITNSNID